MQRRTLLTVGAGAGVLLALVGGTLALVTPGRKAGALSAPARAMFTALAKTVLGNMLPADAAAQSKAIEGHVARVQATLAGLPPTMQAEADELITIVSSTPGRLALVGLGTDWSSATAADIEAALQSMRSSSVALRQQAYHALRDMTNASYFADASTWPAIGYPGPRAL